jgi:hypothetical protein
MRVTEGAVVAEAYVLETPADAAALVLTRSEDTAERAGVAPRGGLGGAVLGERVS